jgi:cytochrome c biogenesis protein CcdA/thiol-disulfide isomerase/thioredoxin
MLQTALAFGAGLATVASPCILPMLPLLLGAATARAGDGSATVRRHGPAFIVLGFVLSFVTAALLFGASTRVLGLSQDHLRTASLALLLAMGILLVWPALLERAMAPLGGLADVAQRMGSRAGAGYGGKLLIGATLGLLWTPCAGPVLASMLALLALGEQPTTQIAGLLGAYALGAGLPMLVIAYGGQAATGQVRALARHAGGIRRGFGVLVIATVAAMHWQLDTAAVSWLSRQWPMGIGSAMAAPAMPAAPAVTQAPEFDGIDNWFNSPPLAMSQLRGKVVLIDFWTYDCINCLNTLPHIKRWHDKYKDQGLVVVGVHTPEFAFERETPNLQAAIRRLGVTWPVAQDNRFRTWTAWRNQYWPAVYLVDREGRVVFRHAGEGDYDKIEQQIRQALDRDGPTGRAP